jgi:exonuclease SbcC
LRPIELSLTGLHSYRDQVTVDFTELGRYGLFGIFGRIGSGKSTLLDAITLALYGLVDRVSTRSRRGLVNLGSKGCEVRFRFAIDRASGSDIYEVHRAYRDVDGVAQRTASRVVQLTGIEGRSKLVLAEREADVNQVVQDVVGLGPEDFVRAVVLPQGKFSQLLHLKGQERRQMLQRIFQLQAYGEDLRRKVRDRLEGDRTRQTAVGGELAGIGDASPSAVRRAEAESADARTHRVTCEAAWKELSVRVAAATKVREQYARHSEVAHALGAHLHSAPEQQARQARIERAQLDRPLMGLARQWLQRASALDELVAREGAAAEAERLAVLAVQEAEPRAEAARHELELEEPKLLRQLHQLEGAAGIEQTLSEETARLTALAAELTRAEGALGEADRARIAASARVELLEAELRKTRREYNRSRVSADERDALSRASKAAELVQAVQKRLDQAQREEGQAREGLSRAGQARREAEASVGEARQQLELAVARVSELERSADLLSLEARDQLAEQITRDERQLLLAQQRAEEREAARLALEAASTARGQAEETARVAGADRRGATEILRGAERALREAEQALENARSKAVAASLAARLSPSSPCPVCGSSHHPAPATGPGELPTAAVEAHRSGRERAAARHEEALDAHARATASLEAAQANEEAARRRLAELELGGALDPITISLRLRLAREAQRRDREADQLRTAAQELARQAQLEVERRSAPVAAAQARVEVAQLELETRNKSREQLAAEAAEAWVAFDKHRGALTLLEVPSAAAAMLARDRRCEVLQETLDQMEAELAKASREAEAAAAALEQGRTRLVRDQEAQQALAVRVAELEGQLQALTGGQKAEQLAEALARALAALRQEVEEASARIEQARQRRERLAMDAAVAAGAARTARSDVRAAREAMAEAARAGGLELPLEEPAVAVWLEQQPSDEQLASWQEQVHQWQVRKAQLEAQLETIGEVGILPLPDAAYGELLAQLDDQTAQLEKARERVAVTARVHADLTARTERWQELTEQRGKLETELGRLDELGALLRGDRFVEYVANDHLAELVARASAHLRDLTGGRYSLGLDDESSFVVIDQDAAGGVRPVHTLSGGESFLTALALALALSAKVQERSTRPLGFFFLDEGFGTLDPEALDRVMTAIEGLRDGHRLIGLISHLPTIRERVPRYLWVEPSAQGSRVQLVDS